MGNSADWTNAPDANVSGGPNTKNEGYDDAVPRYEAPAASHDDGGMLSSEEGELINYKTLNWWYVALLVDQSSEVFRAADNFSGKEVSSSLLRRSPLASCPCRRCWPPSVSCPALCSSSS